MLRMMLYAFLLVLAGTLLPEVYAGQSTFISGHGNDNVTFAVTVPGTSDAPNDIFFYISGPKRYSWIGFGFGENMKGTAMFIVYSSSNGKNFTLSPRVADGHSEPSYRADINVEVKNRAGVFDDRYYVIGQCHNCRDTRETSSIDFKSTTQKMIYAIGPDDVELNSDSKSAGLRRHDYYGKFTMDMVQASSGNLDPSTSFPINSSSNNGTEPVNNEVHDRDFSSSIHAVFMAGVFVILFPLGTVWLRIFGLVRAHWITQASGFFIILIGAGIGVRLSKEYNRSKKFTSPHQIIGFILLFLLLAQIVLGALHHRIFKRQQKPTIMSIIHRILGPVAILLGIVNGAIGFKFASVPRHIIGYAVVIIIVSLMVIGASLMHNRHRRRKAAHETPAARNFQSAYVSPDYQHDIPLGQTSAPPPYTRPTGL